MEEVYFIDFILFLIDEVVYNEMKMLNIIFDNVDDVSLIVVIGVYFDIMEELSSYQIINSKHIGQ